MRNIVHGKQIFLVVEKSNLLGIKYLNILMGSVETTHVNYLHDYQSLPCAPSSNSATETVSNTVRSHEITEALCVFCCFIWGAICSPLITHVLGQHL